MIAVVRHIFSKAVLVVLMAGIVSAVAHAGPGLSPDQKTRLKSLAMETRTRTERIRDELRRSRMDLFDVYSAYQLDERKAKAAMEKVSKSQRDLLKGHLENQLAIRRILNADQFEQFNEMFARKMHGGGDSMGGLHHFDEPGPDWFPDGRILKSMDLSQDQMRRLKSVIGPGSDRRKVFDRLTGASRQMIEMYRRYDLDEGTARKVIDSIHSAQQDMAALNLRAQQAIRSALTQAQFERYRNAMVEKMKQRGPGRKPRRD